MISFLLIIPLLTLLAQERQDIRERAAEPPVTIVPPVNNTKTVTGYVYIDNNQNGEREPQEKAYPNATIKITQLNSNGTTTERSEVATLISDIQTDTNGYFRYTLPSEQTQPVSYVIKLLLPEGYKTINTNPVVIAGNRETEKEVVEFGLFTLSPLSPTISGIKTGL